MPTRVVKTHIVRRNEILSCAESLFNMLGYEDTTVSAIIGEAGIAKGTFYHYFASKEELLDSLADRVAREVFEAMQQIVEGNDIAAEKLRRVHETAGAFKSVHAALLLEYLRALYRPENLIARHKMNEKTLAAVVPAYARIVRQGIQEGAFDTKYPDECAEMLLRAWCGLRDTLAADLIEARSRPESLRAAERKLMVYEEAAERVLGAAPGSLHLADANRRALEGFRRRLTRAPAAAPGLDSGGKS